MAINLVKRAIAYGMNDGAGTRGGKIFLPTPPVVTNRAPAANDKSTLGSLWTNRLTNTAYMLTSPGVWTQLSNVGGAATFSSVTTTSTLNLPGPVFIRSGAGVPAGALALHIGDLYINTTAATAATRIYIATAVGVWTNLTAAA
jgi:hypothetical protein